MADLRQFRAEFAAEMVEALRAEEALVAEEPVPLEDVLADAEKKRRNRKLANEIGRGLRAMAAFAEANPELADELAYALDAGNVLLSCSHVPDPAATMAAFATAAVRAGAKVTKSGNDSFFHTFLSWGPVGLKVYAEREQVCERVVTGSEVVKETVPDPERLAQVPLVEVEKVVETYEWKCAPLLAATGEAGAS